MLSSSPAEPDFAFSRSPRWGVGPNPRRRPAEARGRRGDVSAASEAAARAHAPLRQQRAGAMAGRGQWPGGAEGSAPLGAVRPLPAPLGLQPRGSR